jgi:hypothetical protein
MTTPMNTEATKNNCMDACVLYTFFGINSNMLPSKLINEFTQQISNGEDSKWHYLWIYPINLAASLIGIALAPIAALVDMFTATIFYLLSGCCVPEETVNSSRFHYVALSVAGVSQLTLIPFILFIRIFYPPAYNTTSFRIL